MENGERKTENGERRTESGKRRTETGNEVERKKQTKKSRMAAVLLDVRWDTSWVAAKTEATPQKQLQPHSGGIMVEKTETPPQKSRIAAALWQTARCS